MEQYISKDIAVTKIKKRFDEYSNSILKHYDAYTEARASELGKVLVILNTLEVKEIDLKDSVKETLAKKYIDYTFKRHNINPESKEGQLIYYAYMHGMNQCLDKLNVQKRE